MELSNEDSLRLNVLIAQQLRAVRIDESTMTVHALSNQGEAKVALHPTCRDDKYLRFVRELLSMHALGSPGGYPVFLKRWTRMGQVKEQNLDGLLLLGEPEAIVAVAHSPDLDEDLARRAWWAMSSAEVARRMLANPRIANSVFGAELAAYIIDYLPFETEPHAIVESVKRVLQPGLIEADRVRSLWQRAERKSVYYVGFLQAIPDELPLELPQNELYEILQVNLQVLLQQQNPFAVQLVRIMSPAGQAYLHTLENALHKLSNQEVVVLYLDAIEKYFHSLRANANEACREIAQITASAKQRIVCSTEPALQALLRAVPECEEAIETMLALALVSEELINPIFAQTDAVGSVMRKKLVPVTSPLGDWIQQLKTP